MLKKKRENVKDEEIENEFFDEILKKRNKKSESAIFKKLERIN